MKGTGSATCLAPFVPVEYSFCDFELLWNKHKSPFVATTSLPPCDQIVECVNVWSQAEGNPTERAPKNNSVTHHHSPI
jgi:hypothetical protein